MPTTEEHLRLLLQRRVALIRLSRGEWDAIEQGRDGGSRLSLTFPHEVARLAQPNSLAVVAVDDEDDEPDEPYARLFVGLVTSIASVAFFDSRVVVSHLEPVVPRTLLVLLSGIDASSLKAGITRILGSEDGLTAFSPKLGEAVVRQLVAEPINEGVFARIVAELARPIEYRDGRALQQDAIDLVLKAFGGGDVADGLAISGEDSGLARLRVQEDALIEHDARSIEGWTLNASDVTGRARFTQPNGERLEVITANKRPLEEIFGVDLIYLNERRRSLVMVQYKMMEPLSERRGRSREGEREWIVRLDNQFLDEVERMKSFTRDLSPNGPYRLNSGPFFVKLVKRNASTSTAGILISLEHLTELLKTDAVAGPRGGLRISYRDLDGHYLRGEPFIDLVRSGYIGSRGATTDLLERLLNAALVDGRGVVGAVQRARGKEPSRPLRRRARRG
jgi:hypothetical protein